MSTSRTINAGAPTGLLTLAVPRVTLGAAGTTITVPGLNLDTDGQYWVELYLANNTASQGLASMTYNADTTATNYWRQAHGFDNVTDTGGRANDAFVAVLPASSYVSMSYKIVVKGGRVYAFGTGNEGITSGLTTRYNAHHWVTTGTNVTSLTITCTQNMASGSYVEVYKIGNPQEGTSFPSSPGNGHKFRRTDLKLDCTYYTGIGWLSDVEYTLPIAVQASLIPVTGTSGTFQSTVPADYQIYLTRWDCFTYVPTTNSGTHYWTPTLSYLNSAGSNTNLDSFSTGTTPDAANTYYQRTRALNVALSTNARAFYLFAIKTNSPGNLTYGGTVYYRRIIT